MDNMRILRGRYLRVSDAVSFGTRERLLLGQVRWAKRTARISGPEPFYPCLKRRIWSGRRDSNSRQPAWKEGCYGSEGIRFALIDPTRQIVAGFAQQSKPE